MLKEYTVADEIRKDRQEEAGKIEESQLSGHDIVFRLFGEQIVRRILTEVCAALPSWGWDIFVLTFVMVQFHSSS